MEGKFIKMGNFMFKKIEGSRSHVIKAKDGEYVNIRSEDTDFLRKAILKEVDLDDSYDVYVRYKFDLWGAIA